MIRLYIGKSGSGKDYFLNQDIRSGEYNRIVSYTTRPRRPNEIDGRDYNFLTKEEFDKVPKFESRCYETKVAGKKDVWYYGSPILSNYEIEDYVGVVDLKGAQMYIDGYGAENIELIYVTADDSLRKERAKKRGGYDETEWERRLEADNKIFSKEAISKLLLQCEKSSVIDNNYERR